MADEQLALNSLQDLAKDAAKGLVEDTEVYKKAEDVVEKYPRLSATVSGVIEALATGEISTSFDVGKDKEIGFILNPEEKRAQLESEEKRFERELQLAEAAQESWYLGKNIRAFGDPKKFWS